MLRFVIRKIFNKKWMALSLLIGDILLIAIGMISPMYSRAVNQRLLTRLMSDYIEEKNTYPTLITQEIKLPAASDGSDRDAQIFEAMQALQPELETLLRMPAKLQMQHFYLSSANMRPVEPRSDEADSFNAALGGMNDPEDHIRLIAGRMFSEEIGEDGAYEVIVSRSDMVYMNLMLDEVVEYANITDSTGNPIRMRVVGVFENADTSDALWTKHPSSVSAELLMSYDLFRASFIDTDTRQNVRGVLYTLLDHEQLCVSDVEAVKSEINTLYETYNLLYEKVISVNCADLLDEYTVSARKSDTTLTVLQMPILVLLVVFLFMVSGQMLENEQDEISILKSRGASGKHILSLYCLQSSLIALVALVIAFPTAAFLCRALGSANAFLEFVQRKSLTIEYTGEVLAYALLATLLCVIAATLPTLRYARMTIVDAKRRKHARRNVPMWQKLFIDVIGLGVSIYGLYSYNNQKELLAQRVADGAALDPILYLCCSLFIASAALFMLRVIPLIAGAVFSLFRKQWSPALYASFTSITRDRRRQGFVMVFLMLTVAMGLFNAGTARTINHAEEEQLRYDIGTDVVLAERWKAVESDSDEASYIEPDFGRFQTLDCAESVTKVFVDEKASARLGNDTIDDIQLMAIHTREFGQTAYLSDRLSSEHWFNVLNALAEKADNILISQNMAETYGLKIGDTLTFSASTTSEFGGLEGTVAGIVEYFPSYPSVSLRKGSDGQYRESVNYLIVANIGYVQSEWGIQPYRVWMRTNGSTKAVHELVASGNFSKFEDYSQSLVETKNDPVIQSTNGLLTLSFITILLLCSIGFLIFWVMSIRARALQFGIFRAMGLSMREVLTLLLNEQLFISGTALAAGLLIGKIASRLYIPLIGITYSASEMSLPLEIVSSGTDTLRLVIAIGGVILACIVILATLLKKMKIAQTLKLGED